jgi:hypothetical protein
VLESELRSYSDGASPKLNYAATLSHWNHAATYKMGPPRDAGPPLGRAGWWWWVVVGCGGWWWVMVGGCGWVVRRANTFLKTAHIVFHFLNNHPHKHYNPA